MLPNLKPGRDLSRGPTRHPMDVIPLPQPAPDVGYISPMRSFRAIASLLAAALVFCGPLAAMFVQPPDPVPGRADYAYGPFGEAIHATGPAAQANPWRWASKYLDEETGLYYFGLRYYDPVTGQWLSREPLGERESVNLYSYCQNDPVNKIDVLGMSEASFNHEMLLFAAPEFQRLFEVEPLNWETWRLLIKNQIRNTADRHLDADEKYTVLEATSRYYQRMFEMSLERKREDRNYARPIIGAWERERRRKERAVEIGWAMLDTPIHLGTAAVSGLLMTDATCGTTWTWNGFANGGGWGLAEVGPGERAFAAAMAFIPFGRVENVADDVVRVGLRTERGLARGVARPWAATSATPRVSVLGTYLPNPSTGKTYAQFAEEIGARRFALPPGKFTQLVQRAETVHGNPLHYNQLYLDSIVRRGDIVLLNISRPEMEAIIQSSPNALKTLRWEIDDLLGRGYSWGDDLKSLVPHAR